MVVYGDTNVRLVDAHGDVVYKLFGNMTASS